MAALLAKLHHPQSPGPRGPSLLVTPSHAPLPARVERTAGACALPPRGRRGRRPPAAQSGRGGWSSAASGPAPLSAAANMAARRPRTAPGQSVPRDPGPRGEGAEARQPALRWRPRAAFTPLCREPVGIGGAPTHTRSLRPRVTAGPVGGAEGGPKAGCRGELVDARAVGSARGVPVRCENGSGVLSVPISRCMRVSVLKCVGLNS